MSRRIALSGLSVAVLVGVSLTSPGRPTYAVLTSASSAAPNLLSGDQSTFATSAGGWVGSGATVHWTPAVGADDPGALELSPQGAPPAAGSGASVSALSSAGPGKPGGAPVAAEPGFIYEASAQVMGADAGSYSQVDATLLFWSAAGTGLLWEPGTPAAAEPGSWTTTSTAVAVAPPGAAYVAMGVSEWSATGPGDVYVDDATLSAVRDAPSPVSGPLHTSGTQIIDGTGHVVVLRGISYVSLATEVTPPDLTAQTFAQLHGWGATMVRIMLNEDLWDTGSCAYQPAYRASVAQAVSWTTSLGMVALLTLMAGSPGDIGATGACPAPTVQNMADAPGSDTFWSSVAATFKSNPLVAFDLFNEPNGITPAVWLDGGPQSGFQGQGMQQLYDDVRNAGASNLTFVEGDGYANIPPPPGSLLSGYGIVYDAHYYTCPHLAPPQCGYAGNPYDPSGGLDPWASFQQQEGVPVFVGEFGWPSAASGTYNGNVIAYADAHGWGWAAYTFDTDHTEVFDLVAAGPASWPLEPTDSGMPVLAAMAAHAGGGGASRLPGPAPSSTTTVPGAGTTASTAVPSGPDSGGRAGSGNGTTVSGASSGGGRATTLTGLASRRTPSDGARTPLGLVAGSAAVVVLASLAVRRRARLRTAALH